MPSLGAGGAINENTAAVAYLFSPHLTRRSLPLDEVCQIAHQHDVPVIVDGASMLPPRKNLRLYLQQGADMVIFSGGKGVRGPQGTGILCGRKDLIDAAAANANPNPNQFIARPMKVTKEEIVGLVTALEMFVQEDEEAEMNAYRHKSQQVVDALVEIPGLELTVEQDDYDHMIPSAVIHFGDEWSGPSKGQVLEALAAGQPAIHFSALSDPDKLEVDPTNLEDSDVDVLARRLREELLR